MGPQILIIPTLFAAICVCFILINSCYHRWRVSSILKKKRDAAKISLVNILQMTNAVLITPVWTKNGAVKSQIRPTVLVSDDTPTDKPPSYDSYNEKGKTHPSTFDPRNPNVLSSILLLNDQQGLSPPCYEDLYGSGGAVFTFKSLSPERDELPPPPFSPQLNEKCKQCSVTNEVHCIKSDEDVQFQYSENGSRSCILQVPSPQDAPVPSQERRNSSAVLYL